MDSYSSFPALRFALALVAGLACGCGGRAHQASATFEDAGTPDAGDGSPDASNGVWVGRVMGVPAGEAFVGSWIFDPSVQRFRRPMGCNDGAPLGEDRGANRKLAVRQFWLQEGPVTNQLYGFCFSAGACTAPDHDIADPNPKPWDDPARYELPVYARHDQAEEYCQWANGRLPTLAELSRAAQGDAEIPGVAALTQAVIDCAKDSAGNAELPVICAQLQLMNYFQTPSPPLYRTNRLDLDHGPYGHTDLFGSVWEWTQTFNGYDAQFCALADGSPDFVTFDPKHERNQSNILGFASVLLAAVASGVAFPTRILPNATNQYNVGFRCAFDNMQ
jgi:formylglycine-generating enzyme required for sulfatase activity